MDGMVVKDDVCETVPLLLKPPATFRISAVYTAPLHLNQPNYTGGYLGGYCGVSGAPIDLSGCTAKMQVRYKRAFAPAGDPLFTLTDADGLVLGGATGAVTVTISSARAVLVLSKKAWYDLLIKFPSGDVVKLLEGPVNVEPWVTVLP